MLMRSDPFRDLDRLMEGVASGGARGRTFPMDAYQSGDDVVLLFDLPGVDPQSIELTIDQHVLTVRAERDRPTQDGQEVIAAERPYGTFIRRVFLGDTLDTDRISADYHDGVLRLTIPVSERAKPRKIEVAANGSEAQPVGAGA